MITFYVSLVGPLCGLYLEVKLKSCGTVAKDKLRVREWAAANLGNKVWCSVYLKDSLETSGENIQIIGKTVYLYVDEIFPDNYHISSDYR
jgi:hypothetical protein